jgi:bifunctional non-homologous end joining protein LigD
MAPKKNPPDSSRKRSPYTTAASSAVDAQLERYRSMRNFDITTEPSGNGRASTTFALRKPTTTRGLPFVIQKHEASHLHYDFRLSWGGVLKSWAVAKGPSYNPHDRRLAVEVEDHPLEYGGFEGIIPQGQYGGGTVMIWDQGTWWPQLGSENVDACLRSGHLKFEMNGSKMKGKWALIRMKQPAGSSPDAHPNWLLIKEHDKFEHDPTDPPITEQRPNSSITGRSLKQIASAHDHVWDSSNHRPNRHTASEPPLSHPPTPAAKKPRSRHISAKLLDTLPQESQADFITPQLAIETATVPTTGDWLHELKLDGYRIQARKSARNVQLLTRTGIDWTHRMPTIAAAIAHLPAHTCTLDGEVVVLSPDGNSSFALLQASFQNAEGHPLTYFLFDLLHLDGHNTRDLTLRERKQLLAQLLPAPAADEDDADDEILRLSEDIPGHGDTVFHHACKLHAEGILSKRADAPYRSTRNSDWLKSKCLHEQELVIAGFTLSTEGPDRIGSLLLGYYETPTTGKQNPSRLIYAGRTGTGFSQQARRDLLTKLVKLRIPESAIANVPHDATRGAFWVRPTLVAQVRFATWTSDNLVRQAAFLGLREDKPANEVIRESATVAPQPKRAPTTKTKPHTHASHRTETLQRFTLAVPKPKAATKSKPQAAAKPISTKSTPKPKPATKATPAVRAGLTHPDKILDPTSGLTKQQLADYYATVADLMLPHIANRPLSLVRCPNGTTKPCFFQKHVGAFLPSGINTIDITDKTSADPQPYITLNTTDAIIALAQMNALEVHPWGSTNNDLDHPDRLILDLDPDPTLPWTTLAAAAAEVRQLLKDAGLESFLKLTGGKGLHIVAPIQPTLTWDELKTAAHNLVLSMERNNPALYLTKMTKSSRTNKIFLDYLRNQRGATAVAPYSPRARAGAHVSLPLPWSALKETTLPVYSIHDLPTWRNRLRTNPWKALPTTHQQLDPKQFTL